MASGGEGENRSLGNSALDLAADDAPTTDLLSLGGRVVDSLGQAAVQLSQGGLGTTVFDAARLAVVEHPNDVQAYVCDGRVLLGRAAPVQAVQDPSGADVRLPLKPSEPARLGEPGTPWLVTLTEQDLSGQALLLEVGGGGRAAGAAGIDAQVPGEKSTWTTVRRIHPRRFFDRFVVDSLDGNRVRLLFNAEYPVRRVVRVEPVKYVTLSPVGPVSATGSSPAAVTEAVTAVDGNSAELAGGESLELRYRVPPPAKDLRCDAFLVLDGTRAASKQPSAVPSRALTTGRPVAFALHHPEPNPFTASTRIRFDLPRPAWTRLEVFDLQGRRVARLANELLAAGSHSRDWQGVRDGDGRVQPGVYLCRLMADTFHAEEKLVVTP